MSQEELLIDDEPELDLEPEGDDEDVALEDDTEPEQEPEAKTGPVAVAPVALMEVLPADFPLPALTKFVPNPLLKVRAEEAANYALSVDVTGPEGIQRADVALTALRASQKAIEECFAEPVDIANQLHKRLTGLRAEWLAPGKAAVETVGRKIYQEQRRLEAIAAEERRKAQAEADRLAREQARREAEAAAKAKAPATVVEELKRQAETATAAPVATPATVAPPVMRGTTVVKTWKARFAGCSTSAVAQPDTDEMDAAQIEQFKALLAAIVIGKAPITAVSPNWSVLNGRAKSDKSTLSIPGIEAYEDGAVRAKGGRK